MNAKNWCFSLAAALMLIGPSASAQSTDVDEETVIDEAGDDVGDDSDADTDGDDETPDLEPTHTAHYTLFAGGGYSLAYGDLADGGAANVLVGANFAIEINPRFAVTAGAGYLARLGGSLVNEARTAPESPDLGTHHFLSFELGVRGRLGGTPTSALRLGGGLMGLIEISSSQFGFSRATDSGLAFYQEFTPALYLDVAYPIVELDSGSVLLGLRVIQDLAPAIEATGDVDSNVFIEPGDGPTGRAWYTGLNLTLGWEF
jgi:hypothetical protein